MSFRPVFCSFFLIAFCFLIPSAIGVRGKLQMQDGSPAKERRYHDRRGAEFAERGCARRARAFQPCEFAHQDSTPLSRSFPFCNGAGTKGKIVRSKDIRRTAWEP
jgi:hypothetical protein